MDSILPRKMWATLEPYHAMVYFAPESFAAWEELGLPRRRIGYFVSRSAAMGRVDGSVVAAVFYNFNPEMIAGFIPSAWDVAEPAVVLEKRLEVADAALRRMLGEGVTSEEMTWAAVTAMTAMAAASPDGRPLFAGHATLRTPTDPHLQLWHALTLWREYRGDGHVHALASAGLSGLESLVSYAATGELFDAAFYRRSRGWTEEQWAEGEESLRSKGWIDGEGALTDAGKEGRAQIEELTDHLSMEPWQAIGQERADELRATVRPWSRAIVAAGGFGQG